MHTVFIDTAVWVDHLRRGVPLLPDFLLSGQVTTHPFVIGELACENLSNRAEVLQLLSDLPRVTLATNDAARHVIETHRLGGNGLGWADMHLPASALLSHLSFWTRDRRLAVAARALVVAAHKQPSTMAPARRR